MTPWHVDQTLATRYAEGGLPTPLAASVEAHVTSCSSCQRLVGATAPAPRLAAAWSDVEDRLDQPRAGLIERGVRRLGLSDADARLAVSAPALRGAWLLSITFLLVFAVLAAGAPRVGPDLFLLLAPVLPVLGVGLAYGPWVDPTYETTLAAPYSSVRLILVRTGTVLAFTAGLAGVAGVLLPGPATAVVWLLPSAALVVATLALAAWLPALAAALVVSGAWLAGLYGVWINNGTLDSVFSPDGQMAAVAVTLLALVLAAVAHRTHAYDLRRFM